MHTINSQFAHVLYRSPELIDERVTTIPRGPKISVHTRRYCLTSTIQDGALVRGRECPILFAANITGRPMRLWIRCGRTRREAGAGCPMS